MDNQVFVFGSFSEDEACQYQYVSDEVNTISNILNSTSPQMINRRKTLINKEMVSPLVFSQSTVDGAVKQHDAIQLWPISDLSKINMSCMPKNKSPPVTNKLGIPLGDTVVSSVMLNEAMISEEAKQIMNINLRKAGPVVCNGSSETLTTESLVNHVGSKVEVHEEIVSFNNVDRSKLDSPRNFVESFEYSKVKGNTESLDSLCRDLSSCDSDNLVQMKAVSKSWAALHDSNSESSKKHDKVGVKKMEAMQITELSGDLWIQSLNNPNLVGKRLHPRGLINRGNLCFLTATLQALISCSPFVHLLHTLYARGVPEAGFPTLQAFVDFFKEFEFFEKDEKSSKGSVEVAKPFRPSMFDSVLHSFNPDQPTTGFARNRQEDAQEFLSYIMDQFHNELLRLEDTRRISTVKHTTMANEEDDWETVGPKNRTAVVRTHAFDKSALSDIFGGELCSVVKTKGSKASVTVQPFLVLHLDILYEAVHNVEDALKLFAAPETLEGYKTMAGKAVAVGASKSLKIQTLPRVLILHLKRFSYGSRGSDKLHKPLNFPFNLTLGRDLLANANAASESRNYELVATLTHHGKDPSRGHYTTHSKQLDGQWLRFDDGVVSVVGPSRVLQEQVYLLFYRRCGLNVY